MKRSAALLLLLAMPASAELLLIVREDSKIAPLTERQVVDLYLGRSRTVPPDYAARPIDLEAGSALRQRFYTALTGRSESQIDAYWAQLVFAGRVVPLKQVEDTEAMVESLREDPHAIGYLAQGSPPPGTRVVLRLEERR